MAKQFDWNEFITEFHSKSSSNLDDYLKGQSVDGDYFKSMQAIAKKKSKKSHKLTSGTRVSFVQDMESLLTYANPPNENTEGTVVKVRTAFGDSTTNGDFVYVKWDCGRFFPILRNHIKISTQKVANSMSMRVSNQMDLSSMFESTYRDSDLVHKATQDLWSLRKEGGDFVLERLFQEDGSPLKV